MADEFLTIGDLAARTGVTASALRYYEQLGIVRPARRESGQRRYARSAVDVVGVVRFLQAVGFTRREVQRLIGQPSTSRTWRDLATRKLDDLDRHIRPAQAARLTIEHALACPRKDILKCPNFWDVVAAVLEGKVVSEAHAH